MNGRKPRALATALLASLLCPALAAAAEPAAQGTGEPAPTECPLHAEHMGAQPPAAHGHDAELRARGDRHMGFRQDATTHRFVLLADGGAIEVTANDPADRATIDQIRAHLRQVAAAFAAGDYSIPEAVHARVPPGAREMAAAGQAIGFGFSELPAGGRLGLAATSEEALAAVHEFLRFQIADHGTGDPPSPPQP